jgi:hypothetical protein
MSAKTTFTEWRKTTDTVTSDIYGIDIDDAGLDDGWLEIHWRSGETPKNFVEWFGRKYDLTSKRNAGIEGW